MQTTKALATKGTAKRPLTRLGLWIGVPISLAIGSVQCGPPADFQTQDSIVQPVLTPVSLIEPAKPLSCTFGTVPSGTLGAAPVQCVKKLTSLLLNEVMFRPKAFGNPFETSAWVELFNSSFLPVVLDDVRLLNLAGDELVLPKVTIPPEGYFLVVLGDGVNDLDLTDGRGVVFFDGVSFSLGESSGALGLVEATGAFLDFVAWHDPRSGRAFLGGPAYTRAVAAGEWPADSVFETRFRVGATGKVHTLRAGDSMGRDATGGDRNRPRDWFTRGGRDAAKPSPGLDNRTEKKAETPDAPAHIPKKKWLVLLYMAADNDLENDIWDNVNQIEKALQKQTGQNKTVDAHFVVQFEGVGDLGAQRGLLGADGSDKTVKFQKLKGQAAFGPGEVEMANPATLKAFIEWSLTAFQGKYDKRALVISGHGNGWKGLGDDGAYADWKAANGKTVPSIMTMAELRQGISRTFDVIAFDMCSMAALEVAYQLHDKGRDSSAAFVASELTVPGEGFAYSALVGGVGGAATGADLGKMLVDAFDTKYAEDAGAGEWSLSAFKLGPPITELYDKVNQFALDMGSSRPTRTPTKQPGLDDHLNSDFPSDNVQVRVGKHRSGAASEDDVVDLYDFVERVGKDSQIPAPYRAGTAPIMAKVVAARVANKFEIDSAGQLNGLSIYFPLHQDSGKGSKTYTFNGADAPKAWNDKSKVKYGPDGRPAAFRDAPLEPRPNAPGFLFAQNEWVHFLHRMYEPVAHARCRAFNGANFASCRAVGSTNFDGKLVEYMWDLSPGISTDDEDVDRDGQDEPNDDVDAVGDGISLWLPAFGLAGGGELEGGYGGLLLEPLLLTIPIVLTVWNDMHEKTGSKRAREADQDLTFVKFISLRETWQGESKGTLGNDRLSFSNVTDEPLQSVWVLKTWAQGELELLSVTVTSDQRGVLLAKVSPEGVGETAGVRVELEEDVLVGEDIAFEFVFSELEDVDGDAGYRVTSELGALGLDSTRRASFRPESPLEKLELVPEVRPPEARTSFPEFLPEARRPEARSLFHE